MNSLALREVLFKLLMLTAPAMLMMGCIQTSPWVQLQHDITLDETNQRVLIVSSSPGITSLRGYSIIKSYDTRTQQTTRLGGYSNRYLSHLVVNDQASLAYVVQKVGFNFAIISVDLNSGKSRPLFNATTNTALTYAVQPILIFLPTQNQLLIIEYQTSTPASVQRYDIASASMTLIADENTGLGPSIPVSQHAVFSELNNLLFVSYPTGVFAVDVLSGDRFVMSDATLNIGSGPGIENAHGIDIDDTGQVIYLIDRNGNLLTIDATNGARSIAHTDTDLSLEFATADDLVLTGNTIYYTVVERLEASVTLSYEAKYLARYNLSTGTGDIIQDTLRIRQKERFPVAMSPLLLTGVLKSFLPF